MKKILSVILALAMLLTIGAVIASAAGANCACDGCTDTACTCTGATCADSACVCACGHLSGFELWKNQLTTGKLGEFLQKVATWGDWVLKFLYYVCFGWLAVTITIAVK